MFFHQKMCIKNYLQINILKSYVIRFTCKTNSLHFNYCVVVRSFKNTSHSCNSVSNDLRTTEWIFMNTVIGSIPGFVKVRQ